MASPSNGGIIGKLNEASFGKGPYRLRRVSSPIGLWQEGRLLLAKEQGHGREEVQRPSRQERKETAQGQGKGQGRIKGANKRIGLGATITIASPA